MAPAGNRRADVCVGELNAFRWRVTEEFFQQAGAAGETEFLGEDAERVFRSDEVDAGDAGIGFERAEKLAANIAPDAPVSATVRFAASMFSF